MSNGTRPNASDIASNFIEGGWSAFSEGIGQEQKRQQAAEAYELAAKYAATFKGAAGKAVLEDLVAKTIARTTWDGNLPLDQATSYGLMREGQNKIVAYIFRQLELAASGPPLPKSKEK